MTTEAINPTSDRSLLPERAPPAILESARVQVYTVPTDAPESDGTLSWDETTLILVEIEAANCCGLGYTYSHEATAMIVHRLLWPGIEGRLLREN